MEIRKLYRYKRKDGGVMVSPNAPESNMENESTLYRIIAADGMLVTQDGEHKYPAIDTEDNTGWYEVEDPDWQKEPLFGLEE